MIDNIFAFGMGFSNSFEPHIRNIHRFVDYRRDIVEAIRKADNKVEAGDMVSFRDMYSKEEEMITVLMNDLVKARIN